jgi:hypothetical protein
MRPHHNLNILIKRHQEAQQAFDRELAELAAQHLGDIGLADPKQFRGFYLFEAPLLQDCVNLENQLRFNQMPLNVRIVPSNIPIPLLD